MTCENTTMDEFEHSDAPSYSPTSPSYSPTSPSYSPTSPYYVPSYSSPSYNIDEEIPSFKVIKHAEVKPPYSVDNETAVPFLTVLCERAVMKILPNLQRDDPNWTIDLHHIAFICKHYYAGHLPITIAPYNEPSKHHVLEHINWLDAFAIISEREFGCYGYSLFYIVYKHILSEEVLSDAKKVIAQIGNQRCDDKDIKVVNVNEAFRGYIVPWKCSFMKPDNKDYVHFETLLK